MCLTSRAWSVLSLLLHEAPHARLPIKNECSPSPSSPNNPAWRISTGQDMASNQARHLHHRHHTCAFSSLETFNSANLCPSSSIIPIQTSMPRLTTSWHSWSATLSRRGTPASRPTPNLSQPSLTSLFILHASWSGEASRYYDVPDRPGWSCEYMTDCKRRFCLFRLIGLD